jgi:hypothetical protein
MNPNRIEFQIRLAINNVVTPGASDFQNVNLTMIAMGIKAIDKMAVEMAIFPAMLGNELPFLAIFFNASRV